MSRIAFDGARVRSCSLLYSNNFYLVLHLGLEIFWSWNKTTQLSHRLEFGFLSVSHVSFCCVSHFNPLHMRLHFIRSRSRQQIMKSCVLHVCIKNFYNSTRAKAFKFIIGPRKVMRLRFRAHIWVGCPDMLYVFLCPRLPGSQMHSWMKVMQSLSHAKSPQTLPWREGQTLAGW